MSGDLEEVRKLTKNVPGVAGSWGKGADIGACLVVPGSPKSPTWVEKREQEEGLRGLTKPDRRG